MTTKFKPPPGVVKVVATGATPDGGLRATVMFTPDGSVPKEILSKWPSAVFEALSSAQWQIPLSVGLVRVAGPEPVCAHSTYDDVAKSAVSSMWTAQAARRAWNNSAPPTWLDKLWANDFALPASVARPEGGVWSVLSRGLKRSDVGDSMKDGDITNDTGAKGPAVTDRNTKIPQVVTQGPPDANTGTNVDAIVPARQSELAVLLEMQRSLELCATARAAQDSPWKAQDRPWNYADQEANCAGVSHDYQPDSSLDDLWVGTRRRYKEVAARIEKEICNIHCENIETGPPPLYWASFDAKQMAADASSKRDTIDKTLQGPLDSQQAANQPQGSLVCVAMQPESDVETILNQRFYAIQGSPSLSRLYGLTIDVVLSKSEVDKLRASALIPENAAGRVAFLLLSIDDRDWATPTRRKVWTLAKWRHDVSPAHFWPASRLEVGRDPKDPIHPLMTQFDGVLVLGQAMSLPPSVPGNKTVTRFELTSLDVRAASESALDKRRRGQLTQPQTVSGAPAMLAGRPADWARKTFSTAGFSFLDRGRLEQAVSQFAARNANRCSNAIYLDANDLTIGYRVDVCVIGTSAANRNGFPVWRSLMARQIEHGTHKMFHNEVSRVAPLLMGAAEIASASRDWADTLDDAALGLPARMIYTAPQKADAYVEECVAQWNGEPMAAHCAGPKIKKITPMSVGAGDTIRLPNSHRRSERRPPTLRFGHAYRFGMRAVYPGGLSLPVGEAQVHYESREPGPAGRLSLPSSSEKVPRAAERLGLPSGEEIVPRMRRFLRHERIDLPSLLMPRQIVDRERGPMGYERGAHAIVRSADGQWSNRATPTQTQRIFAPPCVDIHFAALHGVFDRMKAPEQGLKHVRYDAEGGGFPYITTISKPIVGINGHTFSGRRAVSTQGDRGDLVYEEGGDPSRRPIPYFPDPAARYYVLALRYAGTPVYLAGKPLCVDVYGHGNTYPNVRVLVVNVLRHPTRRARFPPSLDEIVSQVQRSDQIEMLVSLAPGEDFEIDVWCIPDPAYLADRFAVIEGVGTVALASAQATKGPDSTINPVSSEELKSALAAVLPAEVCERLGDCDPMSSGKLRWVNEGIGGLDAPPARPLAEIANAFFETLKTRPLDEIAAVQTLRVTHATSSPYEVPLFAGGSRQPAIARDVATVVVDNPAPPQSPFLANRNRTELRKDQAQAVLPDPPLPEYTLTGDLLVELRSTDAVDIYATTAFPSTTQFDDPNRGRSLKDKRQGSWPSGAKGGRLSSDAVFGFIVAADGVVTLPRQKVLLLRVENVPVQVAKELVPGKDGRTPLRLEWVGDGKPSTVLGDVKVRHVFPDGKARRLDIEVTGRARHGVLMRSADSLGINGHPLIEGTDIAIPAPHGDHVVPVWLDATTRPAEPIATSPIPAFVWKATLSGKTRIAVVRIPLGRGWYSSGEEERLGIVLWPPNVFDRDPEIFANDCVPRNVSPGSSMALEDFIDDDLGPGGRFVTRWGADPLRPALDLPSTAPPRTFVDPAAFGDLVADQGLGFRGIPVSEVEMPAVANAGDGQSQGPATTLRVSLVTYTPRFDIETEQWYVDAAIEHPFEYQPFLRLGLVRYQEHAPRHLRVSFPVVQWVQLLPRRDTRVNTVSTRKDMRTVEVVVEGPGDTTLAPDRPTDGTRTVMQPKMTMRLVREYWNAAGVLCRQVNDPQPMTCEVRQTGGLYYSGPLAAWSGSVDVPNNPDSKYSVYIEERIPYLPAGYRHEPVAPALASDEITPQRTDLVHGGPRFSVTVQI